jgi:hypothetical protein
MGAGQVVDDVRAGETSLHHPRVSDVTLHDFQFGMGQRLLESPQVEIDDAYLVPLSQLAFDQMAADEPGTAGN